MEKNGRAVLRAEVRSLAVHLRRVVHFPEYIEQLLVAQLRWIKGDLHDFRVTRFVRANIFVGGIKHLAAAVAHCRIDHSRHLLKSCFNSPEASRSKRCNLWHGLLLADSFLFATDYGDLPYTQTLDAFTPV